MQDEPEFDYEAWLEERRIADENRMRRLFGECPLCGSLLATSGDCRNTECNYTAAVQIEFPVVTFTIGEQMSLFTTYLDAPTHCPTCSQPVDADTGFCTHCGER